MSQLLCKACIGQTTYLLVVNDESIDSFLIRGEMYLQMDLMFLLDGAVWAWRARRTSVAEGEPGSIACVFGGVLDLAVSVTGGWSISRGLVRGEDVTLAFCYRKADLLSVSQHTVMPSLTESWRFLDCFFLAMAIGGDQLLESKLRDSSLWPSVSVI